MGFKLIERLYSAVWLCVYVTYTQWDVLNNSWYTERERERDSASSAVCGYSVSQSNIYGLMYAH